MKRRYAMPETTMTVRKAPNRWGGQSDAARRRVPTIHQRARHQNDGHGASAGFLANGAIAQRAFLTHRTVSAEGFWIASSQELLAMTEFAETT
jgi:hypothetical protein